MDENNAVSVLEDLIETCKDGQKGYQDAASHVKRPDLKTYFNEQSLERAVLRRTGSGMIRLGKPDKKVSGPSAARFTAPGSTPKSVLAVAIKRSWNR